MAYKVIILYRLYMPSYVLGTFTEYPSLGPIGSDKNQMACTKEMSLCTCHLCMKLTYVCYDLLFYNLQVTIFYNFPCIFLCSTKRS